MYASAGCSRAGPRGECRRFSASVSCGGVPKELSGMWDVLNK